MMRFAVAITIAMIVLTAAAGFLLTRVETSVGVDFLRSDDLKAIGMSVKSFQYNRTFLPMAVTQHTYASDCAFEGHFVAVSCEVRIGDARATFDEVERQEQANKKTPNRPREVTYEVKLERNDKTETDTLITVRAYPTPRGGEVSAEVWMREEGNFMRARVAMTEVPAEMMERRRSWCERHAHAIALILLGQVRDSLPR